MKKLLGVLVFLLVLGCGASSSIHKKHEGMGLWNVMEKPIEDVIKVWGAPTKIEKITKDGNVHQKYTWQVTITERVGYSPPVVYRHPGFAPIILSWGNPGEIITKTRFNLLWVDQNGKVYHQDYTFLPPTSRTEIDVDLLNHAKRIKEMSALVETKDPQVVETLIALLNDKDDRIQSHAIHLLGQLKDQRAVEPLIATLQDPNANVRGNAAFVLGQMGDHRAVDPLTIIASKDENLRVRSTAETALKQLKDSLKQKGREAISK